jgi:N-acetylneuraminate synthase
MAPVPASAFSFGDRIVGGGRALLIAEVAQAHDGSLGLAHAFVDAAAAAGADAIKFQTHIAAAESTFDEPFRVKFSQQDATRYEYWRRMEFTPGQWAGLAGHARDKGLAFLSSAFSVEAVALLQNIGMPAWKVASGELGSDAILAAMLATGAPFIVSSGMSPWSEIDAVVARIKDAGRALAVLQCTSRYPTPYEAVGLNVMAEMRARYGTPVGLSDHSGRPASALAAIARGADIVELHLTLDRGMFGPDVASSLTIPEFRQVSEFRDALTAMDANPVDKDKVAAELASMRAAFRRSLAPRKALAAGTVLSAEMLGAKKPGTGIAESELPKLIGRRLVRDVVPERLLGWDDIESSKG